MYKKIAILLFALLIFQMVMYARLYANEFFKQSGSITRLITISPADEGKDYDIDAYLKSLGIETSVDEARIEEEYASARIVNEPVNGNATLLFSNPEASSFRLDIYNVTDGLIASFVNVRSEKIEINKTYFESGAYIYKLTGDSNIHCGTFVLR